MPPDESAVQDLQDLIDFNAVRNVKARYWRAIDLKLWDDLREVMVDDVKLDYMGSKHDNLESFVSGISGRLTEATSTHQGTEPYIERRSQDEIAAYWPFFDYIIPAPSDNRIAFRGYGYYDDIYRREDGRWKMASSVLIRYWIDFIPDLSTADTETWMSLHRPNRK